MTITERKELRLKLLRELYDYHFDSSGSWFTLRNPQGEINLAYKYLESKGLIVYSDTYQQGSVMITSDGIDNIEENTAERSGEK